MDEILDVKGVGDGTSVNVGCAVGETTVGVTVFSAIGMVMVTVTVGASVDGEAQAKRKREKETMIIFFMIYSLCSVCSTIATQQHKFTAPIAGQSLPGLQKIEG